jgi:hypothetical protein
VFRLGTEQMIGDGTAGIGNDDLLVDDSRPARASSTSFFSQVGTVSQGLVARAGGAG